MADFVYIVYTLYMLMNWDIKPLSLGILLAFLASAIGPLPMAQANEFILPKPGVMVRLSPEFTPPMLQGIKVHTNNPFTFDFILDKGDSSLTDSQIKDESTKLIKYFLASLTVPEKDLWVNLSPYEKDRIIPEGFGLTEMGRDLLAEDYMLKQITASLIYPEDEFGKKFWKRVYDEAAKKFHATNIPVNTFNKVWIVPEKAVVYENAQAGTAYVVESKLKVMLEQDYLSLEKHEGTSAPLQDKESNQLGIQIVREIVIPALTKEINEGKNFAQLRQVYNSLVLAVWYKKKIKDSILKQVYIDKNKVSGVNINDPQEKQKIYQQYLQAFKKGVYNYIKEEQDPITQQPVPRKYFAGGVTFLDSAMITFTSQVPKAVSNNREGIKITADLIDDGGSNVRLSPLKRDNAMSAEQFSQSEWQNVNDAYRRFKDKYHQKLLSDDRFSLTFKTESESAHVEHIGSFLEAIDKIEEGIEEGFNEVKTYIFTASDDEVMKELSEARLDHLEWEFILMRIKGTNEWIVSKMKERIALNIFKIDFTAIGEEESPEEMKEMLWRQKGIPHILYDIYIHNHPSGIALPSGQDLEILYEIAEEGNLKCFLRTPEGLTEVGISGAVNAMDRDEWIYVVNIEQEATSKIRGTENQRVERSKRLFHKRYIDSGYLTLSTRMFREKGENVFNVKDYQLSELLTSRNRMMQRWGMHVIANLMGEEDVDLELRYLMVRMISQISSDSIQMDYVRMFTDDFDEYGEEAVEHARYILETKSTSPIIRAYVTVKQHDSIHLEQDNRSFNEYAAPEYSWDAIKGRAERLPELKVKIQYMVSFYLDTGFQIAAFLNDEEIKKIKELTPELLYLYLRRLFQMGHMRLGENDPLIAAARYLNAKWAVGVDFNKFAIPAQEEIRPWQLPKEIDFVTGFIKRIPEPFITSSAVVPLTNGYSVNMNTIRLMQVKRGGKEIKINVLKEGGFYEVIKKYSIGLNEEITFSIEKGTLSKPSDEAMTVKNNKSELGGIDLTTDKTPLAIEHNGGEIKFNVDPTMLQQLQKVKGFIPIITNIQQGMDLRTFLEI